MGISREKNSNNKQIFICYTSFHLAVVKRKLEINNQKVSSIILYMGPKSMQSSNYLNFLEKYASIEYVDLSKSRFKSLLNFLYFLTNFKGKNFDVFYSSNFKLIYTRLLLLFLRSRPKIYRYDDGIGDLLEKSWFTSDENLISNIFFSIFAPNLKYKNLKNVPRAFTIYRSLVKENIDYVPLIDATNNCSENTKEKEKLVILLGQCYSNNKNLLSKTEELNLIKTAVSKFKVNRFIPHPLSKLDYNSLQAEIIEPNVIAEEYVAELLKTNICHVIGFRTTAVFNLMKSLPNYIESNELSLSNLTAYKNNNPLSKEWANDIWSKDFSHIPIHSDYR